MATKRSKSEIANRKVGLVKGESEFWYVDVPSDCWKCHGAGIVVWGVVVPRDALHPEHGLVRNDNKWCFACGGAGKRGTHLETRFRKDVSVERRAEIERELAAADAAKRAEKDAKREAKRVAARAKAKAEAAERLEALFVEHEGLREAFERAAEYAVQGESMPRGAGALVDIWRKATDGWPLSAAQIALVLKVDREVAAREAKRIAEEQAPKSPVPAGRVEVTGEVVSVKVTDGNYGVEFKMLVRDDRGFKVWGSIPNVVDDVQALKGQRVRFSAALERSRDDEFFGFYKRPTKFAILGAEG